MAMALAMAKGRIHCRYSLLFLDELPASDVVSGTEMGVAPELMH